MGVMPALSNHTIPSVFHSLMTDADSDIVDFYPEDFDIDLNGKKFAWQGVALLPFIDEKRLLAAMATRYPQLTDEERARNEVGKEALLFSTRHPLYDEVITHFYSKKAGAPKVGLNSRVSEGLSGKVEKNEEYLPSSALTFPLPNGGMPDLDEDQSISVFYHMPPSTANHKSMLLAGVHLPTPVLDYSDVEATRARSQKSGRGFGGVPLDNQGGGRGRINYGPGGRGGGGFADRSGGNYDNRGGGGNDNRGGGGYNDRPGGGYDNRNGGGYDNRNGGAYGRGSNGYSGGPPPPPHGGMPFDLSNLPPALAQQAAQHGFAAPVPPPGWNGQMPPMPPNGNYGGHNNGYGGQGGYGGGRGGGGHNGYGRY